MLEKETRDRESDQFKKLKEQRKYFEKELKEKVKKAEKQFKYYEKELKNFEKIVSRELHKGEEGY